MVYQFWSYHRALMWFQPLDAALSCVNDCLHVNFLEFFSFHNVCSHEPWASRIKIFVPKWQSSWKVFVYERCWDQCDRICKFINYEIVYGMYVQLQTLRHILRGYKYIQTNWPLQRLPLPYQRKILGLHALCMLVRALLIIFTNPIWLGVIGKEADWMSS